jgi:Holliday junction resolvasome RuvABC endonuclease subunit
MGGGLAFVRSNMSEVVGAAKLCCFNYKVMVYETSPGHVKKLIADHGRADKKYIKANIVSFFNLVKSGPEHECDAAACALSAFIDLGFTGYTVKVPFVKES